MASVSLTVIGKPVAFTSAGICRGAVWSPDSKYCFIHGVNSPYRWLFKMVAGVLTYVPVANLGVVPNGETRPGAWTNNSQYYVYVQTIATGLLRVLQNNGDDTFSQLSSPSNVNNSDVILNPAQDTLLISKIASPWVQFVSFDAGTGAIGAAKTITYTGAGPSARVYACKWSADGNYILMTGLASPWYYLYRVTSNTAGNIALTRVTVTSASEPSAAINRGDFTSDSTRFVTYSGDGAVRLYTISGTTAALKTNFALNLNAANATAQFSPDNKKLYVGCDLGIAVLYYTRSTDLITGDVGPDAQPNTTAQFVGVSPDGKYVAVSYQDSDYLAFFAVVPDAVIKTTYGKYVGDIRSPNTMTFKYAYGKYTGDIVELHQFATLGYSYGQQTATVTAVVFDTEYPEMPKKGVTPPSIMLEPILPVTRSEDPGPLPQINTTYGKYTETILPMYIFPATINVSYGTYTGDIRGPQTADLLYSYGQYTAQIFGPLNGDIIGAYGQYTAEILIDPLKYPTDLLYLYGKYDGQIAANFPLGAYLITSYGQQTTAIVGDFPIATDIDVGYGTYTGEILTEHNFGTIADAYQAYTAELDVFQSPNGPILGVYGSYFTDIRIDYGPILTLDYTYGQYSGVLEASRPQSILSRYGAYTEEIITQHNFATISESYGKYDADIRANIPKGIIALSRYGAYTETINVLPGRFLDANYRYGKYTAQLSMEPEFPSKITFMIIQP